jgi:hypothetical protein
MPEDMAGMVDRSDAVEGPQSLKVTLEAPARVTEEATQARRAAFASHHGVSSTGHSCFRPGVLADAESKRRP